MNPFRRPSVRYGKSPIPATPYQKAAQAWDERIGSARVQARNWRLIAFGNLVLAGGLAAALVWQATRGTIVPWVVQVDKLGEAQVVAPAIADYQPSDAQVAWYLARFIEQVRAIPIDPVIVRQNWLSAYDFVTDRGGVGSQRLCPQQRSFRQSRTRASRCRCIERDPRLSGLFPDRLDRAAVRERCSRGHRSLDRHCHGRDRHSA